MSEYVVRWRHYRYADVIDCWYKDWHNGEGSAAAINRVIRSYPPKLCNPAVFKPAQHGGKTWCGIYSIHQSEPCDPDGSTYLTCDASAETVCSWRDQFDRRVGRLYSLALALCELPIDLHTIELYATLNECAGSASDDLWDQLCGYITLGDKTIVKHICAEIVQSWKQR